jgi:hypothetical protein
MAAAKPARSAASFVDIQRPLDLPSLPSQAVPFRSPAKAVDGTVPEFPSTYVPSESRATRTESARRVPSRPTAATDNNEYRPPQNRGWGGVSFVSFRGSRARAGRALLCSKQSCTTLFYVEI